MGFFKRLKERSRWRRAIRAATLETDEAYRTWLRTSYHTQNLGIIAKSPKEWDAYFDAIQESARLNELYHQKRRYLAQLRAGLGRGNEFLQ